jgi:hypothetical protein
MPQPSDDLDHHPRDRELTQDTRKLTVPLPLTVPALL